MAAGKFKRKQIFLQLIFVGCIFLFLVQKVSAQEQTNYSQFWNEFCFTRALKGKWSLELNLGQTWTSSPAHSSMFSFNSQLYLRGWVHYHISPRWKLSYFWAYYYNRYVPEIKQKGLPELRTALQAIYYFHKVRYTLTSRLRIEDRHLKTDSGNHEAYYRVRAQGKILYPINGKRIRQGVCYGIGSLEFYFKSGTDLTGHEFYDRSKITAGLGYSITDDTQVEVTYVNEFLPRDHGDQLYNALQLNFKFNNFIENVQKRFFPKKEETQVNK